MIPFEKSLEELVKKGKIKKADMLTFLGTEDAAAAVHAENMMTAKKVG